MSSHDDLLNHEPAGTIESAYQEHVRRREAGDWTGLASLFAEDARYFDPIFGWQQGRTAIGNFLEGAMAGLAERVFRDMWHVAEGNRLVIYWQCSLLGESEPKASDADGGYHGYHGMSALKLSENGLWTEQMDIYDREEAKSSRRDARL